MTILHLLSKAHWNGQMEKGIKFGQKEGAGFLVESWQSKSCDLTGTGNSFNAESSPNGKGVEGKVTVFKYF